MASTKSVMRINNQGHLEHYAACPDHLKRSSKFLGVQQDLKGKRYEVFQCSERDSHSFLSLPDKTGPQRPEDVAQWMYNQKMARLSETDPKRRGK